jgi:hypothetical protein
MLEARALPYGPRTVCPWSDRGLGIQHAQILIWIMEFAHFADESK